MAAGGKTYIGQLVWSKCTVRYGNESFTQFVETIRRVRKIDSYITTTAEYGIVKNHRNHLLPNYDVHVSNSATDHSAYPS